VSYQLTTIALYGVRLAPDAARSCFLYLSERQYRAELAVESEDIYEDWKREYVGSWFDIADEHDYGDPVEFFTKYAFCERLVPRARLELTTQSYGTRCRYHSDFRCDDASRRDDRHYASDVESHVFGIYLASNGYGYKDPLADYTDLVSPIAIANFADFCAPVLSHFDIRQPPTVHLIDQIW
jgi:hypothetical protein